MNLDIKQSNVLVMIIVILLAQVAVYPFTVKLYSLLNIYPLREGESNLDT